MKRISAALLTAMVLVALDAGAVELRRPYEAALAVSYGYDNTPNTSGCTDHECGSICYNGHSGSDFPLSIGTNVLAGADGQVSATNNSCADYGYLGNTCGGRCGNYVQILHPSGDYTIYCHLKRDSLTVSTGDTVSCGQKIGESASSGSSTGPHLHLGWRPGGGSSTDVYTGSCNNSPGAWVEQGNYGEAPSAQCQCVPSTEVCDGRDNNCDGTVDSGDVCEIDLLHEAPHSYTQPATTDVDGDGLQNICARFHAGFRCFRFTGSQWESAISTSLLAEADGWGSPQYYSTIRMGDIDGDGRADLCARHSEGLTCWRSMGDDFEEFDTIGWSDDNGWAHPQYYTTIRLVDIDGDGRDDVCARGASGWRCYLSETDGFGTRVDGPEWSNARGFDRARYYGTIRTGDIDGNGQQEVCMREHEGFACYRFNGETFEHMTTNGGMADEHGWGNIIYWPSIRLADIDGNGTLALCARDSSSLFCRRFDGDGFGEKLQLGGLSNDSGWADPTNYATLRVGDVTGDGSDDLCIRANAGMLCYRVDGQEVSRWDGPEWSNANGWDALSSHGPTFVTNLEHSEIGALCGRSSDGLSCEAYSGEGFEAYPRFEQFTDEGGWTARKYYSTLRMGQGPCRAQRCEVDPGPEDNDEDDDYEYGPDAGIGGDAGSSDPSATSQRVQTSSCSATSSTPSGAMIIFVLFALAGLRRRRRRRSAILVATAAVVLLALSGCDRSPPDASSTASTEEAQAQVPQTQPSAATGSDRFADYDVLAIYGTWRVMGDPISVPGGTDGPLRYRPLLVDDGELVEWPLAREVVSEVRLVGDGPTLFALGVDGSLEGIALDDGHGQRGQPIFVDDHITSQVSPATDGCCLAYIRIGPEGQVLRVYRVDDGATTQFQLGHSLGWAPAVAAGGDQVAWTASPAGFAAIHTAHADDVHPRILVNGDEEHDSDNLDPFPTGIHVPVWTPRGIAFEQHSNLWLVDENGDFIGRADGSAGMFWDESRQELVDRRGQPIVWSAP